MNVNRRKKKQNISVVSKYLHLSCQVYHSNCFFLSIFMSGLSAPIFTVLLTPCGKGLFTCLCSHWIVSTEGLQHRICRAGSQLVTKTSCQIFRNFASNFATSWQLEISMGEVFTPQKLANPPLQSQFSTFTSISLVRDLICLAQHYIFNCAWYTVGAQ